MVTQIINIDIFRRSVVILHDGCIGEICKWLEEHDSVEIAKSVQEADWETAKAITFCDGLDVYVISPKFMATKTIVHELTHATFKILKIIGVNPVQEEETYAYLYEYLYDKAVNGKVEQ